MRPIFRAILMTALVAAVAVFAACSADSPTAPTSQTGGPGSSADLALQVTANSTSSQAGNCVLVGAFATFKGQPVPDGSSIDFSALFGSFQNGGQTISLVTQGGEATAILCSASSGTSTVKARVLLNGETAQQAVSVNFTGNGLPPPGTPFISQCATPSSGPVTGGTAITITGGGFCGGRITSTSSGVCAVNPQVFFKVNSTAVPATVSSATDTAISAVSPAFPGLNSYAATPAEIDVQLSSSQILSAPNCFTYTALGVVPVLNGVVPSSGSKLGSSAVTLVGSGFTSPAQVRFGTSPAQVNSLTFTQIQVTTPPLPAGSTESGAGVSVPVTVTNLNCTAPTGQSCTSNSVNFLYVEPMVIYGFTPQRGDSATPITITGQGFSCPVVVTFGGLQGTVVSCSNNQVVATPPPQCGQPSAPPSVITVTSLSNGDSASTGGSSTSGTGTFIDLSPAVQSGPTPGAVPSNGPTQVTVTGVDFFSNGNTAGVSVSAAGGTATLLNASSNPNATETLLIAAQISPCASKEIVTITNTATGCSTTFTLTNATTPTAGTPVISSFTFVANPQNLSGVGTINFTSTASGGAAPYTYIWTFSGGSATCPTCANPVLTVNCSGGPPSGPPPPPPPPSTCQVTVTLVVTDSCGQTSNPTTQTITIPPHS